MGFDEAKAAVLAAHFLEAEQRGKRGQIPVAKEQRCGSES